MSDLDLLEAAAKAAGLRTDGSYYHCGSFVGLRIYGTSDVWNPLKNDGDVFRLAVKLCITTRDRSQYNCAMAEVRQGPGRGEYWEPIRIGDYYAATRRAVVRAAAASIGVAS